MVLLTIYAFFDSLWCLTSTSHSTKLSRKAYARVPDSNNYVSFISPHIAQTNPIDGDTFRILADW